MADDKDVGGEGNAFEALERDFQEVLQELVGDKSLERFRVEYDKLHRALKKSHENEKRLIKKCRELNAEIIANAAKVQTALKLSQEDQNTISSLKKEIEKAWKMVDASHEKEARAKDTIQQLKLEIQNLSRLVEQGAGLSVGQENTVKELMKVKEDLTRERDYQTKQINDLKAGVTELEKRVRELESDKISLDAEVHTLKETLAARLAESSKENKQKEKKEKEMKDIKSNLEEKAQLLKSKQAEILQVQERISRLEVQVKEQRSSTEKSMKEFDQLTIKTQKLHEELEEHIHANTQLLAEDSQRKMELKMKEDEIARLRVEVQKAVNLRETHAKHVRLLEEQKKELEGQKDKSKDKIQSLEKQIENYRHQIESDRKHIDHLLREREMVNKNLLKAENATLKQKDLVRIEENSLKNLEQEIAAYKSDAQKMRRMIYQLEREREKYGNQAADAMSKFLESLDLVKRREARIFDLQKRIAEGETKLKQQQNLYEAVRSDRNLYSKNLIESQDEIAEMKRKFKIMNHQIEQLKEEITSKDHALVKEHFDHMKVLKDREHLYAQQNAQKSRIAQSEETIATQIFEINKMNRVINEADQEGLRQKKEFDQVVNERDILGTQLIRRNDELSLLYEKIKIQQSVLNKGETQYRERLEDIRVLKQKIMELKREVHLLKSNVNNIDVLKKEVYHLQRELLQERTKVKALSEELENPMNVHRWRKLESSDPQTFELIQKVQTLQKRLIGKTEEVQQKDALINEREKLYQELKSILARQPGPEVAEQLKVYMYNIKDKQDQMKAMSDELHMYNGQVNEYKYEIERITRELQGVKKKYYDQKKREGLSRDLARKEMLQNAPRVFPSTGPRFTGGGFSLSQG